MFDETTLIETAEHMFVRRLLKNQCPTTSFDTQWDNKDVVMYEFNFELHCVGTVVVLAYKDFNNEFVVVKSFMKS